MFFCRFNVDIRCDKNHIWLLYKGLQIAVSMSSFNVRKFISLVYVNSLSLFTDLFYVNSWYESSYCCMKQFDYSFASSDLSVFSLHDCNLICVLVETIKLTLSRFVFQTDNTTCTWHYHKFLMIQSMNTTKLTVLL